jgi:putative cell wall-binding protein
MGMYFFRSKERGGMNGLRVAGRPVVLAGMVLLAALVLLLAAAPALATAPDYNIIRGTDRYDTAVKISKVMFPGALAADSGLVLAPGETFPEALCGAPLAAAYGGPVLLTQSGGLNPGVKTEILRLAPRYVFCVGLSDAVVAATVATMGPGVEVTALRGTGGSVYEMSYKVAKALGNRVGDMTGATGIITPGTLFPDAIGVSPLACAKLWPVLLTESGGGGTLNAYAAQALTELGITTALKVGTYVTLPDGVTGLANLSGTNRYATNSKVAEWSKNNAGLAFTHLAVVTGDKFPDALAAGPYLALDDGILLLTAPAGVPAPIAATITAHAADVAVVDFIGLGNSAIWEVWPFLPLDGPPSTPNLKWPSNGPAVAWLEAKLASLTYRPGPIDGVYDQKTMSAVIAFQKWEGLTRDGKMGAEDWAKLLTATTPVAHATGTGAWVEVDKARQVLMYIENGVVLKTLHVCTGSASVGAITPSGDFKIYKRFSGEPWPHVYYPRFFTSARGAGECAVHGYPNVPTYPASHGCVRICMWEEPTLFNQMPLGSRIVVY